MRQLLYGHRNSELCSSLPVLLDGVAGERPDGPRDKGLDFDDILKVPLLYDQRRQQTLFRCLTHRHPVLELLIDISCSVQIRKSDRGRDEAA